MLYAVAAHEALAPHHAALCARRTGASSSGCGGSRRRPPCNPQLAVEVAQCQRLVKGYSDTHERGLRNYETVMACVERPAQRLAPATLRELRDAALADEHGDKLRATLGRHGLVA